MGSLWKLPFFRCLAEMAAAFRQQLAADLESGQFARRPTTLDLLHRLNRRFRKESALYRLLDRAWLFPLSNALRYCQDLSDKIEQHGFFRGARLEFERLGLDLEVSVSDQAQRLLDSDAPILFVGEHPCTWGHDILAFAASLDRLCPHRRDLVVLAWILATAICPASAPLCEPVIVPSKAIERFTHDENGVGNEQPGVPHSIFRSWSPDLPVAASSRRTRESIYNLARRWMAGEHALIYPAGIAGTRALWFPGLGRVIRFAAEQLDGQTRPDPHILFFRLDGAHNYQVLSPPVVSRWHPARLLALGTPRRIAVRYGQTFRLRDWRERFLAMDNRSLARFLQAKFYHGTNRSPFADGGNGSPSG